MARFRLVPERSELWAETGSGLHRIRVHTAGLTGMVEAGFTGQRPTLAPPTSVELEAVRLRSGNALVDGELRRRIDPRAYPTIRAELITAAPSSTGGMLHLSGTLTFHGVTRTLDVEVAVHLADDGTLAIEGRRSIDMRDFALSPPAFLMFRMDPRVQVRARLVGIREQDGVAT